MEKIRDQYFKISKRLLRPWVIFAIANLCALAFTVLTLRERPGALPIASKLAWPFLNLLALMFYFLGGKLHQAESLLQAHQNRTRETDESIRKLSSAVAQSSSVIIITDTEGQIEYVNPRFTEVTGYTAGEVLGKNPRMLKSGKTPPAVYAMLWETVKSGRRWKGELENKRKDGAFYHVLTSISPVRNDVGVITHFVSVQEDITILKQAAEVLLEQKRELLKANQELDRFVYTASHDLKAPLQSIAAFSRILQDEHKSRMKDEAQHLLDEIEKAAIQMGRLINDLMTLSHVTRIRNPYKEVNFNELIQHVLEKMKFLIDLHHVVVNVQPDLPVIRCDRIKMDLVFSNLFNNAIKFSSRNPERSPHLSVTYRCASNVYEFIISDNGIGIDEKDQKVIFDLFHRLHAQNEYEGSGVGLCLAQKIVEEHGGRIWVESRPDCGAAFHFTIPNRVEIYQGTSMVA